LKSRRRVIASSNATKQSSTFVLHLDCFAIARNDEAKKGKRSAERRILPLAVPAKARQRLVADKLAQSAQLICFREPLAFRRSAAALAGASERPSSAQAALHAIEVRRRYLRLVHRA